MTSKIWTRDFTLAVLTNTFVTMVFYMLMSAMTLYAVDRFSASDTLAGLTSSMFVIGSVAARLFAGKLLDVVGRRRMLLASLVVFAIASLTYSWVGSVGLLLAVRFVHGMAFGAGNTAVAASVQSLIPPERRSEGTGYFGLSTTLAMAVGPLMAVTWSASGNFDAVFTACAVASVAGFAIAWVMRLPEREVSAAERAQWWRLRVSDVLDRTAMPIATIMFFSGVAYSAVLTFLATYAVHEGMAQAASAFFMVYAVAVLVVRLFIGRVQDRLGDNAVMYPTMLTFVVGLVAIGLAPNAVALALCGALLGCGFGAMMSCAQAIVAARATPARIGVVTSTFFVLLDVGCGFGPIALGGLVAAVDFRGMYVLMGLLMALTTVLYWWLHGRHAGVPRPVTAPAPALDGTPAGTGRRRVLVGVDGSEDSLRALRYAGRAALVADHDVWVVTAVNATVTGADVVASVDSWDGEDAGQAVVRQARDVLLELGLPPERVLVDVATGHPVAALAERSDRAVLLVVGRRSVSGMDRMFVGSTSLGVVSGARCPVLVISAATTPHETTAHGVVTVAVGARGGDRGALAWGLGEARRRGASLRVVHVTRPGDDEVELRERALARLEELSPAYADVEVLVDLPAGEGAHSAVDELVELSRASDLLVLDARGNRVTGVPLAGTVRGVLAHAVCPVVLAA